MRTRVKLNGYNLTKPRSNEYLRLRHYWIGELYFIRAKRRNGTATKTDIKIAQRELARIRREV